MIFGVGTDIVQIPRIEKLISKYGNSFKSRILHNEELTLLDELAQAKHANFLAKRFAAKEAVSKALGHGIGISLTFQEIVILNNNLGQPYVVIKSRHIKNLEKMHISISLSDDYPIALAFVVISVR